MDRSEQHTPAASDEYGARSQSLGAVPPQRSLVEHVAERISAAICAGVLGSGERLVETRLAEQLAVSRAPIREALRMLEAEGLVKTSKGRGTFVVETSAAEVEHMVTMRAMLEGLAARLVTARARPEHLAKLDEHHEQIKAAAVAGDFARWRELNWSFHELLCAMSDNRFLLASWKGIRNLVRIYLHQNRSYETDFDRIIWHHQAFMNVLRAGEPDEAEQVFRSVLLERGFNAINRPIPPALQGLITRMVLERAEVVRLT